MLEQGIGLSFWVFVKVFSVPVLVEESVPKENALTEKAKTEIKNNIFMVLFYSNLEI